MPDGTSASQYRRVGIMLNRSSNSEFGMPICFSERHASLTAEVLLVSEPYAPAQPFFLERQKHITGAQITTLPNSDYKLLKPIPVKLDQDESGEWVARFEAANIGMSGDNPEEAKELLGYYIVDAMESLLEEEKTLIPKLKRDLDALRRHIRISK